MTKVFDVRLVIFPPAEEAAKGKQIEVHSFSVVGTDISDATRVATISRKAIIPDNPSLSEMQILPFDR